MWQPCKSDNILLKAFIFQENTYKEHVLTLYV